MRDSAYRQREKVFLRVCSCCEMILNRDEVHKEITAHPHKLYALDTHTVVCPECLRLCLTGAAATTSAAKTDFADKS